MKLSYSTKAHAYYLDGARCRSWSAAGKVLEDGYALDAWRKRMVAIGIATRPALVDEIAAHYDDRDKLDEICEQALELANASHGARRGTAIHSITERSDAGVESMIQTDLVVAVEAKWKQLLADHGIEVIPELMERICVWPEERIAGRFDRIVRWDGRLVVLDVKSSDSSIRYPHSTSVQLAGYAYAPLLAGTLDKKGVTTTFEPMPPEVDKNVALVAHVPDEGPASLHVVDIAAGHAAIRDLILPIYRWRSLTTLVKPAPAPLTLVSEEVVDPDGPARRDEIAARLGALTPDEKATAAASWPAHIPTPKKVTSYSAAEHLEVSKLLDSLFWFPVVETPERPLAPVIDITPPSDPDPQPAGRTLCDAVIGILKSLPPEQFSLVEHGARIARVPNLRSGAPTVNHILLVLSEVVKAATEGMDEDVRNAIVGAEPLSAERVERLLVEIPNIAVTYTDDGKPVINHIQPTKVRTR